MDIKQYHWVLLADRLHARLLRCGIVPIGRCHAEEVDSIKSSWIEHEHHVASQLHKRSGAQYAIEDTHKEEERKYFAKQLAEWIAERIDHHKMHRLIVFAPAHFLGALRHTLAHRLSGVIQEKEGELSHLTLGQVSKHPAIREIVGLKRHAE